MTKLHERREKDKFLNNCPKAILFDLDDTILSFGNQSELIWRSVIRMFSPHIPGVTEENLLRVITKSRKWYWSEPVRHRLGRLGLENSSMVIVQNAFCSLGIQSPEIVEEMAESYQDQRLSGLKPYDGAIDTLRTIRALDLRMALVTNGDSATQRRKIDAYNLSSFFDLVLIEGEFGIGKPDMKVYQFAMEYLGYGPEDTWMIGDNYEWEVVAPKQLGITSVWVNPKNEEIPKGSQIRPDWIVESINEVVDLIRP